MPISKLSINAAFQNGKTIMSDCSFTSPCKVAKPFYRDDGYTEIMAMCASPGIFAGDEYDMRFDMGDNTKTIISEQSYRKLYNAGDGALERGAARQNTQIQVGENATLHYVPCPIIPFAGSRFRSRTEISLSPTSKLIYGEILACGRHGMGERFAFSEFSSRTIVEVDGKPVFLDNTMLISGRADFQGLGFFEQYACQGVFFIYGFDEAFRAITLPENPDIQAAISKSSAGYTVRALSQSASGLYAFAKRLFAPLLSP
jgi:urease accessory protein